MPRKTTLIAAAFLLISIGANSAIAQSDHYSELKIQKPDKPVINGQIFEVKLIAYTNQALNAYSIGISYPTDLLEIVGFNDAGSIIDIWQTPPQNTAKGNIAFKGGSTRPHLAGEGLITSVIFKAKKAGVAELKFSNSKVYLANGKGTKVNPAIKNSSIKILEKNQNVPPSPQKIAEDKMPPTIEEISVIRNPLNERQKLLSFIVKDEKSGVKDVYYRTKSWLWWSKSRPALNPTSFSNNVWAISFEVIDGNGNKNTETIYDWPVFLKKVLPALIILLIAFFSVINTAIKRKKVIINT